MCIYIYNFLSYTFIDIISRKREREMQRTTSNITIKQNKMWHRIHMCTLCRWPYPLAPTGAGICGGAVAVRGMNG